ncbi:MAG TPA: DUF2795 domain-containing protein [Pseudonocardia sp.]|nr:DUF2795 domain-containing protein [Pseudonocardia sp.]
MNRRSIRTDVQRLGQVLADLPFPAAKWQLVVFAEEYGADITTREQLWSLPPGSYADLGAVLAALGLAPAVSGRFGYRQQSAVRHARPGAGTPGTPR